MGDLICAALSRGEGEAEATGVESSALSSHQSHSAALVGKTVLALLFMQPCWPGLPRDPHTSSSSQKLCPSQIWGVNQEQIITVRQRRDKRKRGMGVP